MQQTATIQADGPSSTAISMIASKISSGSLVVTALFSRLLSAEEALNLATAVDESTGHDLRPYVVDADGKTTVTFSRKLSRSRPSAP